MPFIGTLPPSSGVVHEKSTGVGTISCFPAGKIPATHLLCNGAQFDRKIFRDLYNFLKNDRVPLIEPDYRIGDVKWFPKRAHIHPDFVPADGQLLNHTDYTAVKPMFVKDGVHQTHDTIFQGDPKQRGFWATDLPDTFRVPDMNGKSLNTAGSLFVRGDGDKSNGGALIQDCMIQSHNHGLRAAYSLIVDQLNSSGGVEYVQLTPSASGASNCYFTRNSSAKTPVAVDASGSTETRPINLAGCWAVRVKLSTVFAIKASGSLENEGYLDVAGLVKSVIDLKQTVAELNLWPQTGTTGGWDWVKHKDGRLEMTTEGTYNGAWVSSSGARHTDVILKNIPFAVPKSRQFIQVRDGMISARSSYCSFVDIVDGQLNFRLSCPSQSTDTSSVAWLANVIGRWK